MRTAPVPGRPGRAPEASTSMAPGGPGVSTRFWRLTAPLVRSKARVPAGFLLGLLVALLVGVSGLNVLNSYVGRDFMTAVADKDRGRVWSLAGLYLGVFGLSAVVAGVYRYTEERLGLFWRRWLTGYLAGQYLAGGHLRVTARPDVDNPDQRIAEDVRTFTATTLSLLLIVLNSTITLTAFSGVLWGITPWLVLAAVGYAAAGSGLTAVLGRRLVGLNVVQLSREADLRAELFQARQRSEAGALGPADEAAAEGRVAGRLQDVVGNFRRVVWVNRNLAVFGAGYGYLGQVLPVLLVAPLYLRGEVEFGAIPQAVMAFAHVLGAFSLVITEFPRITAFGAVIARLGALQEALAGDPPPADGAAAAKARAG